MPFFSSRLLAASPTEILRLVPDGELLLLYLWLLLRRLRLVLVLEPRAVRRPLLLLGTVCRPLLLLVVLLLRVVCRPLHRCRLHAIVTSKGVCLSLRLRIISTRAALAL